MPNEPITRCDPKAHLGLCRAALLLLPALLRIGNGTVLLIECQAIPQQIPCAHQSRAKRILFIAAPAVSMLESICLNWQTEAQKSVGRALNIQARALCVEAANPLAVVVSKPVKRHLLVQGNDLALILLKAQTPLQKAPSTSHAFDVEGTLQGRGGDKHFCHSKACAVSHADVRSNKHLPFASSVPPPSSGFLNPLNSHGHGSKPRTPSAHPNPPLK